MNDASVFSEQIPALLESRCQQLHEASGISIDAIVERGYKSILSQQELAHYGFSKAQRRLPGIIIPLWGVGGQQAGYSFRPDHLRVNIRGKVIKYENPKGSSLRLDCPPRCRSKLGDPSMSPRVIEGIKKGDALASHSQCVIVLSGIWGFE